MYNIAIIVPAYNEEKSIQSVVEAINALDMDKNFSLKVIVVNDSSLDSTSSIASELNCVLLDLPVNIGIGGAMQTGYKYAFDNHFDFAIQVDGDGQHPSLEIPKLIEAIIRNNWDVVIGSRFIDNIGFQSSFMRRAGIKFFKLLLKMLCGIRINDPTSGFRILNRRAMELVYDYYPDEYPEPESLVLYKYHQLKTGEISVKMIERQGGVSSIRGFSSLYYMIKVSLAIFFTFIKLKSKLWKTSSH